MFFLNGGGLDSMAQAVLLHKKYNQRITHVHINYGQAAAYQEVNAIFRFIKIFKDEAIFLNGANKNFTNPLFKDLRKNELKILKREDYVVHFRNTFLIHTAIFNLLNLGYENFTLYVGFHLEPDYVYLDARDNLLDFIRWELDYLKLNVKIKAPFSNRFREDIITEAYNYLKGKDYNLFDIAWSCYQGKEKRCGLCPHCLQEKEIMKKLNLDISNRYLYE